MTPEAQLIAIAEACGWTRKLHGADWVITRPDGTVDYCDPDPSADWEIHRLPGYLSDLGSGGGR